VEARRLGEKTEKGQSRCSSTHDDVEQHEPPRAEPSHASSGQHHHSAAAIIAGTLQAGDSN
jgi:hypothetical protein